MQKPHSGLNLTQEEASPLAREDLEAMAAQVNGTEPAETQPQPGQEQQGGGGAEGEPAAMMQPASPVPSSPGVDMDLTGKRTCMQLQFYLCRAPAYDRAAGCASSGKLVLTSPLP